MNKESNSIKNQVKAFCAQIGADPLLVQGPGGNASWKDGDVLWVKASGTWLADAESNEIFIPVNLSKIQDALTKSDFSVNPEVLNNSGLRPSIETLLHALMPHKVVVHLHAIEILAQLVKINAIRKIKSLVADSVKWVFIDYIKPGAELARAVSAELGNRPDADVVFMGNHGVVIGGYSVESVAATLNKLIIKLKAPATISTSDSRPRAPQSDFVARGYIPCNDKGVSLLAIKDTLINRLRHAWALYPDHVVFLGAEPAILKAKASQLDFDDIACNRPPFIFYSGEGVYESNEVTDAQRSQLRCYFDLISRVGEVEELSTLTDQQVSDLLVWDAEKYRQTSSKNY
jgi:rhamnose utilization protein RhaD (predicted bifunctional aldolase and dehydrogenase)